MAWTDARIKKLKKLWEKSLTASQIAEELGDVTRNAVIGKAHRLDLASRPSPVKKTASKAKASASKAKAPAGKAKAPASKAKASTSKAKAPASKGKATAKTPATKAAKAGPTKAASSKAGTSKAGAPKSDTAKAAPKASAASGKKAAAASAKPKPAKKAASKGSTAKTSKGDTTAKPAKAGKAPAAPDEAKKAGTITAAAPAEPVVKGANPVSLLELNERICKWPIGHPGEPDFHFCGDESLPGQPYCASHAALAYQTGTTRRDRANRPQNRSQKR